MQEMTLSFDSIERYLSFLSAKGRSENTLKSYRADLKEFLRDYGIEIQHWNLENLAAVWLQKYRQVVAPKTTGRRLTTVRGYAKWAGLGKILEDYSAPTPARSFPHPIPEGLDGLHRMAEAAKNPEQLALIGLCGFAGLRIAEALSIRPTSISLHDSVITVRGKGDKTRFVPLSPSCWTYNCQAYMNALPLNRLINYQDRFARKAITLCAERAGLQRHVSSHDLRATFATATYDRTKDLRLVQELLGHADPNTTQVYTGITMRQMKKAVHF